MQPATYTAFAGHTCVASGPIDAVALGAHSWAHGDDPTAVLVLADHNGLVIDLDLRGDAPSVLAQLADHPALPTPSPSPSPSVVAPDEAAAGLATAALPARPKRGRPRLGVVSREVSLLPKHWDWLKTQPKSASATLRLLIEARMKAGAKRDQARAQQNRTYAIMRIIAGDLPGFEEASRALYAGEYGRFADLIAPWPTDVVAYLRRQLAS
jgi:uncharacterized protein